MSINPNYQRVIPRDLFNEAKLLKCLGQFALKIHDRAFPAGIKASIEETGEPFEIAIDESGHLSVENYPVRINGRRVRLKTIYNSKSSFPLLVEYQDCDYTVFDDDGNFDEEFLALFSVIK